MLPEKSVGKMMEATVVAVGAGGRNQVEKIVKRTTKMVLSVNDFPSQTCVSYGNISNSIFSQLLSKA